MNPLSLMLAGLTLLVAWFALGAFRSHTALAVVPPVDSASDARPVTMTYREPAGDGALISLDAARLNALAFSGREGLVLDGGLETSAAAFARQAAYYLETAGGAEADGQSFRIEARSGEVLEMTRLEPLAAPAAVEGLDALKSEGLAERFAAERFLGFGATSLVERTASPAANGSQLYIFKWALVAAESGAELPTSVSVSLSDRGDVVWYLAQRDAVEVDVRPKVEREAAIGTAAELVQRSGRWDSRAPSSVRLQIIQNQAARQQLAWAITFPSRPDAVAPGRPNLRILVDARSGEPISAPQ